MPDLRFSGMTPGTPAAADSVPFLDDSDAGDRNKRVVLSATGAGLLAAADAAAVRAAAGMGNLEMERRLRSGPAIGLPPAPTNTLGTMVFSDLASGAKWVTSTGASAARFQDISGGSDFTATCCVFVQKTLSFAMYAIGSTAGRINFIESTPRIGQWSCNASFASLASVSNSAAFPVFGVITYLRMRRVSGTLFLEYSFNNETWISVSSWTISSVFGSLSSVGLYNFTGDGFALLGWDFA